MFWCDYIYYVQRDRNGSSIVSFSWPIQISINKNHTQSVTPSPDSRKQKRPRNAVMSH